MIRNILLLLICSFTIVKSAAQKDSIKIQVNVCIDGKSILYLQDDKIWWDHVSYDPPGMHKECSALTTVNKKNWKDWKKPFHLKSSLNNYILVSADKVCPAHCKVEVAPTAENKWITKINLDHASLIGPNAYELNFIFKKAPAEIPSQESALVKKENTTIIKDEKRVEEVIEETTKPQPLILEKGEPFIFKNIYFESNQSKLLPESFKELNRVAEILAKENYTFIISGHSDSSGDEGNNKELSKQRAKAVYDYFIQKGILAKRMSYVGEGDKYPLDTNETEEGRKNNRRVELKITG